MKMTKKCLTAALVLILGTSVFAQTTSSDGLNAATAGTVLDNASYFMNVIAWDKLDFAKFYGNTAINSASSANLGYATHIGKNDLHLSWNGNLWASNSYNTFNGLYGFGKLGIQATLGNVKNDTNANGYDSFTTGLTAGYQISDAFDVYGGLNMLFASGSQTILGVTSKTNVSDITVLAGGQYNIKENKTMTAYAGLSYAGNFATVKTVYNGNTTKATTSTNLITPYFLMNLKPASNFTYGLTASIPMAFEENTTVISWTLSNGFSAQVTKMFTINAGLTTTIPTLTFVEDADVACGSFTNTFYAGFSVFITPEVRIDFSGVITPASGVSLNDIWEQNFSLGLDARF